MLFSILSPDSIWCETNSHIRDLKDQMKHLYKIKRGFYLFLYNSAKIVEISTGEEAVFYLRPSHNENSSSTFVVILTHYGLREVLKNALIEIWL